MLSDLDNLIAVSRRYPKPTDYEVRNLLVRWLDRREQQVFDRLVCGQLGFIRHILFSDYGAYIRIAGSDLFQEGSMGLVFGLQGYTGAEKDFKSFIRNEIRRPMNTYIYNRWKRSPWPESLDAVRIHAIDTPNATQHLSDAEYEDLHAKLRGMDDRIRTTMILYYGLAGAEPLSFDKIAAKMGVSRPAVRGYHERGLSALRGEGTGQMAQPPNPGANAANRARKRDQHPSRRHLVAGR